jgi:hypothetical protein
MDCADDSAGHGTLEHHVNHGLWETLVRTTFGIFMGDRQPIDRKGGHVGPSDPRRLELLPERHEPRAPLARPRQGAASARTVGSGVRVVYGGVRHARSERGKGSARRVGVIDLFSRTDIVFVHIAKSLKMTRGGDKLTPSPTSQPGKRSKRLRAWRENAVADEGAQPVVTLTNTTKLRASRNQTDTSGPPAQKIRSWESLTHVDSLKLRITPHWGHASCSGI